MNTIRNLAKQYWDNLKIEERVSLFQKSYPYFNNGFGYSRIYEDRLSREIEKIFYNEVVLKWWSNSDRFTLYSKHIRRIGSHLIATENDIKEIYLKEHAKEQSKGMSLNTIQPNGKSVEENIKTYFDNVTSDKLIEQIGLQPQSVDNSIEFNKWLKDKKQRYLENKEECYNDILSSTTSAIDQFLKSPYQAQKGVLESAVKCNEMFLEFVDNSIEVRHLEQPQILKDFITAIKNEFKDENWDYLDFVADRVIENQPKVNEDNVWDEVRRGYKKLTHRSILSNGEHALLDYLEQHYLLIKK